MITLAHPLVYISFSEIIRTIRCRTGDGGAATTHFQTSFHRLRPSVIYCDILPLSIWRYEAIWRCASNGRGTGTLYSMTVVCKLIAGSVRLVYSSHTPTNSNTHNALPRKYANSPHSSPRAGIFEFGPVIATSVDSPDEPRMHNGCNIANPVRR